METTARRALCACGCGEPAGAGKRFLQGHWSRSNENRAMRVKMRRVVEPANPSGLCMCGCGQRTLLAPRTRPHRNEVAGQPQRFVNGHHGRLMTGPRASGWRGGRWTSTSGYVYILVPHHPMATKGGYVLEHRLVVEASLGRLLQPNEHVHHINGIKTDNRLENLQVLSPREHAQLHPGPMFRVYFATHDRRAAASAAGKKGAIGRWGSDHGGWVTRACEQCSTAFRVRERSRQRFCSRACAGPPVAQPITCKWCGVEFVDSPSNRRQYCSMACAGKGRGASRKAKAAHQATPPTPSAAPLAS
jgi:hypothetical protein